MAIPQELLDTICANLDTSDLCAAAPVNSAFYHATQRELYRHIALDSRNITATFTLARNPRLARHVRSCTIRLSPSSGLLRSFYRVLATAISNMSGLSSLELFADQAASWVLHNDQSYPRLKRLVCSFNLDHNVTRFLNNSDAINELEIDSLPVSETTTFDLRDDALSHLSQFTGSAQAAQVVVPGRPVEHIHLNSGDLTEEVAVNLAKSTLPVLVLGAATSSHSVSLIGTLTQCMERLVHLRIVTTYNFTDAPDTVSPISPISSPSAPFSHDIPPGLFRQHCRRSNVASRFAKLRDLGAALDIIQKELPRRSFQF